MKDVQCYELFGGIALKNHAFFFFIFIYIEIGHLSILMAIIFLGLKMQKNAFFKFL